MKLPFSQMQSILKASISHGQEVRRIWDKHHHWYMGEFWDSERGATSIGGADIGGEQLEMETNYPYAFIDTMTANICPTNPMISIEAHRETDAGTADAREGLINDTFERDKLHAKSWDMATYTSICGLGFSKVVWSERLRRPVTRILNPRNVFFDQSTAWEDLRYIIEAIPMTKEDFMDHVAKGHYPPGSDKDIEFGSMPSWLADGARKNHNQDATLDVFKWCVIYEFHDLRADLHYHMSETGKEPLAVRGRAYKYVKNPYSQMVFTRNLLDNGGISDVKLIAHLQERLNEIDSLELWFAHTSIPIMLVQTGLVDNPEDLKASLANATGPGDIAEVRGREMIPIDSIIGYTRTPSMTPSFDKMRDRCTSLIEFTLGLPQFSRGVYGGADVATEVALADTATRTRNGRRIKVVEDWITDVAMKVLGLWKEFLDPSRTVPLRNAMTLQSSEVDRAELAFPDADPFTGKLPEDDFEDEWFYKFRAIPYSPAENHRLVQLQKMKEFMEVLVANPTVDQTALMSKLLDLLGLREIKVTRPPDPQMAPPGAEPSVPGGGMPSGTPADAIMTGGMPEGLQTEHLVPPGARELGSQPKNVG